MAKKKKKVVELVFTDAASRTMNMFDAANEAFRPAEDKIIEKLTDSLRVIKIDNESGVLPVECGDCSGFGQHVKTGEDKNDCVSCNGTGYKNHKEMKMAAKKKTAKSDKPAKAKVEGRERKILLRLSKDEYNSLQAKATKQEVSMASILRSAI